MRKLLLVVSILLFFSCDNKTIENDSGNYTDELQYLNNLGFNIDSAIIEDDAIIVEGDISFNLDRLKEDMRKKQWRSEFVINQVNVKDIKVKISSSLNSYWAERTRDAMNTWNSVQNSSVFFREVTSDEDIIVYHANVGSAVAEFPTIDGKPGYRVRVDPNFRRSTTMLHELGHCLGLRHDHYERESPEGRRQVIKTPDHDYLSIMSYHPNRYLTPFDIIAIQKMYPSNGINIWSHTISTGEHSGRYRQHLGDVNGDGRDDLIQFQTNGVQGWVGLANPDGTINIWSHTISTGEHSGRYRQHLGDVNGDGRDDLIQFQTNGVQGWVGLANPDGTINIWSHTISTGEHSGRYRQHLGDVNGDGRDDLIQFQTNGVQGWVGLANPDGTINIWSHTISTGEHSGRYRQHLGDVNGDGRDDLIQFQTNGVQGWVGLANPDGTINIWSHTIRTGEHSGRYRHHIGDINGDGYADLVQFETNGVLGWIGYGDSSGNIDVWSQYVYTAEHSGRYRQHIGDVNGDGKADLIQFQTGGTQGWVGLTQ